MKSRYKAYLKINIMSLFFIVVSFISVTLAWFAYSGLASVSTDVDIKAWSIELSKNDEKVSNNIVISLSDIYPGMETVSEIVNIKNLGDSDAQLSYNIISARILNQDNYVVGDSITSSYVEDVISHNYPFHINISLSKNFLLAKGDEGSFKVSISWPLDSGNDVLDSTWGNDAYLFQKNENDKKDLDDTYQIQSSIKIAISVTAEQYVGNDVSSDVNYKLGTNILYDVVNAQKCSVVSSSCLSTYVIDVNNKIGDTQVTLLPDITQNYASGTFNDYNSALNNLTSSWKVSKRELQVSDIMNIISNDITDSVLVRENLSDVVIGNLNYTNRMTTELNNAVNQNGYYKFKNLNYIYLSTSSCYWTNSSYNDNNGFAFISMENNYSKVYSEAKETTCKIVPVISVLKSNL